MRNDKWDEMPDKKTINETMEALKKRGIDVFLVDTKQEALDIIKKIIPNNADINNGGSATLKEIGFVDYLKSNAHGWKNLHEKILNENDEKKQDYLRRSSVAASYFLGSVNAISKTGELVSCDATGSRVSAYLYPAKKVVLIAGTQKITDSLEGAIKRVKEYVFPLENKRAQEAYGIESTLGKWAIIEREISPHRITLILVNEKLGF